MYIAYYTITRLDKDELKPMTRLISARGDRLSSSLLGLFRGVRFAFESDPVRSDLVDLVRTDAVAANREKRREEREKIIHNLR